MGNKFQHERTRILVLTVTTINGRTKGKEIRRTRNGDGCIVVVAMMLAFVRLGWDRGLHDGDDDSQLVSSFAVWRVAGNQESTSL